MSIGVTPRPTSRNASPVESHRQRPGLVNRVDEVPAQPELFRAFGGDPQIPIAGTSTAPVVNGGLQVALLVLDETMDDSSAPKEPSGSAGRSSQLADRDFRQAGAQSSEWTR